MKVIRGSMIDMIRHALGAFFLSFIAIFIMLFLYVLLPQYLVSRYGPKDQPQIVKISFPLSIVIAPTPAPSPSPSPGLVPATVIIPKLDIQSAVELVGITDSGNMDVPKNAADLAWYMYGAKPSEEGNAVLAGHYDTPTGKPAIFYNLRKLQVGDEVTVVSENAIRSVFTVTDKATIPYDKFPNEEVFKTRPGKNLNLITCGGIWDAKKRTYLDRIVVYTTLKETSEGI
ncbi:MAG: class F sortase [Patescibacteria group bacterium]